jgi:hypothetical protein
VDRTARRSPAILLFDEHGEGAQDPPAAFVLPDAEALAALDDAALGELEAEAVAAFDAVREGDLDTAAIEALEGLTEAVETIRAEQGRRETDRAEAASAAEALAARVHADPPEPEAEAPEPEAPEAPAGQADTPEAEAPEGEPAEARAAAGAPPAARPRPGRIPLGDIRRRAPAPQVPAAADTVTITAAGDVPGHSAGSALPDMGVVAAATTERARLLGPRGRAQVARFHLPAPRGADGVVLDVANGMDKERQLAVLRAAANPVGRLTDERGSLVAAGGWCAPSERRYGFFPLEARTGMIDLPTFGVSRGGIEYIEDGGPQLADVMAHPWLWTEQNDIDALAEDGPTKPCIRIPCPDWTEDRLEAEGICVVAGNLADRAFPEMTRRFLDLVLAAHFHRMNQRRIATLEAGSTQLAVDETFGTLSALLAAAELHAWDTRDKYRMDDNAPLEVVLPSWVIGAIRSDVARRSNVDPGTNLTRQAVTAEFAARNLRVQFVQDWQPLQLEAHGSTVTAVTGDTTNASPTVGDLTPNLTVDDVGRGISGAGIPAGATIIAVAADGNSLTLSANATATAGDVALTLAVAGNANGFRETWPQRVRFLLYPPGTWGLGLGGTIDLGVTRDTATNAVNDHVAAWTEEFHLIAKNGPESRVITVPICPDGQHGGKPIVAGDYACPIA